ncbi:MAG: phage tail tape measure protein, partial [Lachnospiraceae bacterium]|nr:phage tail tape measure protein [Lachnospiraceae bacterium]
QAVVDSLAATTTLTNLELTQLADSYVNVGGAASQAGLSIDDVNAILITLSENGLKGGAAGTSLNAILKNLSTPTDKAADALAELNVELYDNLGASRDMFDILADLEAALSTHTDEQRNRYEAMIFDSVAQKGWNMIVGEGIAEVSGLSRELAAASEKFDGAGQAAGHAATVNDGFQAQLNKTKASLEGVGISVGNIIMPILQKLAEKVQGVIEKFSGLTSGQQSAIVAIGAVVAAIAPALIIFGKMAQGAAAMIKAYQVLAKAKATMAAKQAILTAATKIATVAQMAWNAVMSMNPIALIIIAIIALVAGIVALYKKCDWFRDAVNAIWDAIKNAFFAAFDAIKNFFTEALPDAFKKIINFFKDNWQGLLLLLVNPFAGAFKLLYDNCEGFRNFIDDFVAKIKAFFKNLWDGITGIFNDVGQWFSSRFKEAWDGITKVFTAIGQWFKARWGDVKAAFSDVASWFGGIFQNALEKIQECFGNIVLFFTDLWERIKKLFSMSGVEIGQAVGEAFKSAMNAVINTIEGIVNRFIGMINGVIKIINMIPGVSLGDIGNVSFPRLARGGVLKEGTAMVAEAGPELISMVNGKAVVTPLTGNSVNRLPEDMPGNRGGDYNQTINISSPKPLSPHEVARQTKIQTRNLVLAAAKG